MKIRIEQGEIRKLDMETRLPFRYGIAVMSRLPHVFVRLEITVDGVRHTGVSADHLPPKWFTKDPSRDPGDEIREMEAVIARAVTVASGMTGSSVFELWRDLYDEQLEWGKSEGIPPLLGNFGVSLVERALLDGFARCTGASLSRLLRRDMLGIDPVRLHSALAGTSVAELLPPEPRETIVARHTVGLSDPVFENGISEDERVRDGLPQSLEACIRFYGLRHFKLKLGGDPEADLSRMNDIASVLLKEAPSGLAFSLDGNESFPSPEAFLSFWERLVKEPDVAPLLRSLLFVEQPLHRDVALADEARALFRRSKDAPLFIIDESDGALGDLSLALDLGYAGTSHKNCKGVFKGVAGACLLEKLRRDDPLQPYILSGEDLSNTGPVALLQDLAVQANLGIASVERNGHHYFAGLSAFPETVCEDVLRCHPDVYTRSEKGWPRVRIENGLIDCRSAVAAPFGTGFAVDLDTFERVR